MCIRDRYRTACNRLAVEAFYADKASDVPNVLSSTINVAHYECVPPRYSERARASRATFLSTENTFLTIGEEDYDAWACTNMVPAQLLHYNTVHIIEYVKLLTTALPFRQILSSY